MTFATEIPASKAPSTASSKTCRPPNTKKNLRELVAKIKAASDTQIFATTTPIPEKQKQTEIRIQTDVDRYNEIALRVMREAASWSTT